jgi:hypothetical protein
VGLGLAAHGAAASTLSTACRSGSATKPPGGVSHPTHQAHLFVSDQHRWWLTLTRAAVSPPLRGPYARAHGKYVVVFMTAQNVGKVPQDLGLDQDFAVVDAQGRRFGFASMAWLLNLGVTSSGCGMRLLQLVPCGCS